MTAGLGFRSGSVQRLRRLLGQRAVRDEEHAFVVEGPKLVTEALNAGVPVTDVYVMAGTAEPVVERAVAAGARRHDLAPGVMERVADAVSPQSVAAVVSAADVTIDSLEDADFVVVCVDVRDPGNLGTVLRTAEAAGAGGVICCEGSVDVHSPKTVRASAGSLFHVPVVAGGEPLEVLDRLGRRGLCRLGTSAGTGTPYDGADLTRPTAVVLGNEAHGLPASLSPHLDGTLTIPMAGRTESLNVAMAAAVICFEVARQRRARP